MAKKSESSQLRRQEGRPQRPHLYFRALTVKNVRCFGSNPQTLSLATPNGDEWARWTIILGNNGTGKSTLLQLLDGIGFETCPVFEGQIQQLILFKERHGIEAAPFCRANGSDGFPIDDVDVPVERRHSSAKFDFWSQKHDGLRSTAIRGKPISAWASWTGWKRNLVNTLILELKPHELDMKLFGYGAWRRLGRSTLSLELNESNLRNSHLCDDSSELINAEEWLQRLDYSASKKSTIHDELSKKFDLVRTTLLNILPDVEDIRIPAPSKEYPNPRVLFKTPYGEVQLRQLGFGYQSLIAWVVDFAARLFESYPDSPNPLAEPAVCLVDEVDLHLHPMWQRKLMQYLSERFPKTQFIATAHSPLIVQTAPEIGANVVVLRREGDHVIISNNPIDVQGWRADQILSSELFDNQPLRSPEIQMAMDERTKLLSKQKLTAKDQKRLADLEEIVATLPVGSTPEERNVTAQLKAAAALLDRVTARKR